MIGSQGVFVGIFPLINTLCAFQWQLHHLRAQRPRSGFSSDQSESLDVLISGSQVLRVLDASFPGTEEIFLKSESYVGNSERGSR